MFSEGNLTMILIVKLSLLLTPTEAKAIVLAFLGQAFTTPIIQDPKQWLGNRMEKQHFNQNKH